MQHVINRQIIELGLRSSSGVALRESEAAFKFQQQVSDQFYRRMLAVLGRVFDGLGPEGELVSFDQLVIDLGAVSAASIEDGSWTDELYTKLSEQAEAMIRDGEGRRKPMRRPLGAGLVDQWLTYMRKGRLPWNATEIDANWLRLLLEHLAADHAAVMKLRACLSNESVVVRRIAMQHDVWFLVGLAEVLTARNQSLLAVMLSELTLVVELGHDEDGGLRLASFKKWMDSPANQSKIFWMAALRVAAAGNPEPKQILRVLLEGLRLTKPEVAALREKLGARAPHCQTLLEEIEMGGGVRAADAGEPNLRPRRDAADVEEDVPPIYKDILAQPVLQDGGGDGYSELKEGIFVPYAGLVLLHPFVASFFTRLGLFADYAFVDEAAQRRCLYLLQYVATGKTSFDEYELVMVRVLCGFPMEEPVEREFEPTPAEVEETEGLLDACLGQWTKLGDTSRAGLRESFLHRAGRLYRKDDRLRLDVERSSIDVLLDYLPWGIGLVKLPWMKEMLHVNWR